MVISGAADSYGIYLAGRGSNTLTNNATVKSTVLPPMPKAKSGRPVCGKRQH